MEPTSVGLCARFDRGIQAALYLVVPSVNSFVAIHRSLTAAPGELPMWLPLAVATSIATVFLLASIRERAGEI